MFLCVSLRYNKMITFFLDEQDVLNLESHIVYLMP